MITSACYELISNVFNKSVWIRSVAIDAADWWFIQCFWSAASVVWNPVFAWRLDYNNNITISVSEDFGAIKLRIQYLRSIQSVNIYVIALYHCLLRKMSCRLCLALIFASLILFSNGRASQIAYFIEFCSKIYWKSNIPRFAKSATAGEPILVPRQ